MIRVLIADDHEMVRKGIRSWLEDDTDITVIGEASNGTEAISLTAELLPDVLLVDLHFPDISGIEVIKQTRLTNTTTAILVMTGYERQRAKAVIDAGANGFLNKDEKKERLIDAVKWVALRESGTWVSPSAVNDLLKSDTAVAEAHLTDQEVNIIRLIEKQNKQIADVLFLSEGTVKNHISSIYSKLGLKSRFEVADWARKNGLL
jgi:NarL family two-component system response regulator LiaR